jgi:hypothetical protein
MFVLARSREQSGMDEMVLRNLPSYLSVSRGMRASVTQLGTHLIPNSMTKGFIVPDNRNSRQWRRNSRAILYTGERIDMW